MKRGSSLPRLALIPVFIATGFFLLPLLALCARVPFGDLIASSARRFDIDPLLILAMIEAESSFDPNAISTAGAVGLMQLLPSTAELFTDEDPFDPRVNIYAGARYMSVLLEQFNGFGSGLSV